MCDPIALRFLKDLLNHIDDTIQPKYQRDKLKRTKKMIQVEYAEEIIEICNHCADTNEDCDGCWPIFRRECDRLYNIMN